MRTIAYVDGYNVYHGLLKYSEYKWLDLRKLLTEILRVQDPNSNLAEVKFYTSDIKARYARRGVTSVEAQQRYHRALETTGVALRKGRFNFEEDVPMPAYVAGKPCDRNNMVRVWRLTEKYVEVLMALDMYRDVHRGYCDQILVVSSDTDLTPALETVRTDSPATRIGLILPRSGKAHRKSDSLVQLAHWTRSHINQEELAAAQFPNRIPTRRKPIDKPDHWRTAEDRQDGQNT